MQYTLMAFIQEAGWSQIAPAEQERGMAAYMAFTEALTQAGALKASGRHRAEIRPLLLKSLWRRVRHQ